MSDNEGSYADHLVWAQTLTSLAKDLVAVADVHKGQEVAKELYAEATKLQEQSVKVMTDPLSGALAERDAGFSEMRKTLAEQRRLQEAEIRERLRRLGREE